MAITITRGSLIRIYPLKAGYAAHSTGNPFGCAGENLQGFQAFARE